MYVCMFVRLYVCVRVYVFMYVCVCVWVFVCACFSAAECYTQTQTASLARSRHRSPDASSRCLFLCCMLRYGLYTCMYTASGVERTIVCLETRRVGSSIDSLTDGLIVQLIDWLLFDLLIGWVFECLVALSDRLIERVQQSAKWSVWVRESINECVCYVNQWVHSDWASKWRNGSVSDWVCERVCEWACQRVVSEECASEAVNECVGRVD